MKAPAVTVIDPDVEAVIGPLVTSDPAYGRHLMRNLTSLPPELRKSVTDYAYAKLHQDCTVGTVFGNTLSVILYARSIQAQRVDDLTAAAFKAHFIAVAKKVSPRHWYGQQRHVVAYLRHVLGRDEATRRAPAAVATHQWGPNDPKWYLWSDIRKVWLKLDLQERVQFILPLGTGVPVRDLLTLPLTSISFDQDGTGFIDLPAKQGRPARTVGLFFGEKAVAALVQQAKRDDSMQYAYPDANNPGKPMQRNHFSYLLDKWCKRAGVEAMTAAGLQTTFAGYLLGRGISMQIVAHQLGLRDTSRLNDLHNKVLLAQRQGHLAGQPSFHADIVAGLIACEACGEATNPMDAAYCIRCGCALREDALNEEAILKAQIHDRLGKWLDLKLTTPTETVRQALDIVEAKP